MNRRQWSSDALCAALAAMVMGGVTGCVGASEPEPDAEPDATSDPLASAANPGRAFFDDFRDKTAPPAATTGSPPPAGAGGAVRIAVNPGHVLRRIPRTLFGNNAAVWQGDGLLSATMESRLKTVGVSVLRFPGGSTSDRYHWNGVYPSAVSGESAMSQDWAVSTREFLDLVKRVGAIPLITVNHGFAAYGSLAQATALAADWVEYCNSPNDGSNPNGGVDWARRRAEEGHPEPYHVKYWTVGNEVFGSWETGYLADGAAYGRNFNAFADAMKAVDRSIFVGAVARADAAGDPWTAAMLSNPGTASRVDFLDVHEYFSHPDAQDHSSTEAVLATAKRIREVRGWLDALVDSRTSRGRIPYYMGEFNTTLSSGAYTVGVAGSLFVSKALGELTRSGFAAASLWGVINGFGTEPNGFGAGTHGFVMALANGQAGSTPDYTPLASYYPYYFYTRNFGDRLVESTSSDASTAVYASTFSSGQVALVIINQGGANRSATIDLGRARASGHVNVWQLTGDSPLASAQKLNGVGTPHPFGGPLPEDVRPYHLRVGTNDPVRLDLPKYSVTSVLAY